MTAVYWKVTCQHSIMGPPTKHQEGSVGAVTTLAHSASQGVCQGPREQQDVSERLKQKLEVTHCYREELGSVRTSVLGAIPKGPGSQDALSISWLKNKQTWMRAGCCFGHRGPDSFHSGIFRELGLFRCVDFHLELLHLISMQLVCLKMLWKSLLHFKRKALHPLQTSI